MKKFHYMNQSGHYEIAGVSDEQKFKDLNKAMEVLKFSETERNQIFRTVAAVLHMGM